MWTLDGKLLKAFYGPAEYGGGGKLDPEDKTRFYYHGMEFRLDWEAGRDRLARVLFRPGPGALQLPDRFTCNSQPEMPLYRTRPDGKRQRYFTNCYNSNPTNGASIAVLWIDRDGLAIPVAAFGMANQWKLLQEAAFTSRWPKGVNLAGDYWKNQAMFAWSDLNGDGRVQPDEVVFWKARPGGITVMPDLAIVAARVDQQAVRDPPQRFTAQGVPVYDPSAGEILVAGAGPDLLRRRPGPVRSRWLEHLHGRSQAVRAAVGRRRLSRRTPLGVPEPVAGPSRIARGASARLAR